eukprot:2960928-Prymnesium_polylepis.1
MASSSGVPFHRSTGDTSAPCASEPTEHRHVWRVRSRVLVVETSWFAVRARVTQGGGEGAVVSQEGSG